MTHALWIVQGLLAALFLFAGGMKLVLPLDKLTGPFPLPGWFIRFIGVCEVLGALAAALMPLVVGLLAAFVAYGRWRLAPPHGASRPSRLRPAS